MLVVCERFQAAAWGFAYFDVVTAWLSEIRDVLAHSGRTAIFVGVEFEVSPALQHDVTSIEFRLPDDPAIEPAEPRAGSHRRQ